MTVAAPLRLLVLATGALCSIKTIASASALVFGVYPLVGELGSKETMRAAA